MLLCAIAKCSYRHQTIMTFNSLLKPHMSEADVLSMVAQSSEFESMMVREVSSRT